MDDYGCLAKAKEGCFMDQVYFLRYHLFSNASVERFCFLITTGDARTISV